MSVAEDRIARPAALGAAEGWRWLARGWRLFTRDPWLWIAVMFIYLVIVLALAMIPILGAIAAMFLGPVLGAGLMFGAHEVAEGRRLAIEHLFQGFVERERMNPLLVLGAFAAAATVGAVVLLFLMFGGAPMGAMAAMMRGAEPGAATLATAGVALLGLLVFSLLSLFIVMALLYAPALVMLGGVAPGAALKSSFAACLRNWLPLLVLGVIWAALFIVAVTPLGLGLLVLFPVTAAAVYCSYRDIYER